MCVKLFKIPHPWQFNRNDGQMDGLTYVGTDSQTKANLYVLQTLIENGVKTIHVVLASKVHLGPIKIVN